MLHCEYVVIVVGSCIYFIVSNMISYIIAVSVIYYKKGVVIKNKYFARAFLI